MTSLHDLIDADIKTVLILIGVLGVSNIGVIQLVKNFLPPAKRCGKRCAIIGIISACASALMMSPAVHPIISTAYLITLGIITIQQLGYETVIQNFHKLVNGITDKLIKGGK